MYVCMNIEGETDCYIIWFGYVCGGEERGGGQKEDGLLVLSFALFLFVLFVLVQQPLTPLSYQLCSNPHNDK